MNIRITANTAIITSAITPDEFDTVSRIQPDLLRVKDDKGNDVFVVDVANNGSGDITEFGAVFVPSIGDKLTISISLDNTFSPQEAKEAIFDFVAGAKPYIEKVEKAVKDNIAGIKAAEAAFLDSIEIDG